MKHRILCTKPAVAAYLRCCLLLVCLGAAACSHELPAGIVATVNSQPISLRLLNAAHEQTHPRAGASDLSVDVLRRQYGSALGTLIVYALVSQELQKQGMGIGPERIRAEEARIREDYPGGEFEQDLLENQMDIQTWRELLQGELAIERFAERIVAIQGARPSAQEIQDYYEAHTKEFVFPPSLYLRLLTSADQGRMDAVREVLLLDPGAPLPAGVYEQRTAMTKSDLPEDRRKEVEALKPGGISRTRRVDAQFQIVQLLEELPEKRMSVVEAYPLIERMLMEEKMDEYYDKWLEQAAAKADIRISAHLREPAPSPAAPGGAPPE